MVKVCTLSFPRNDVCQRDGGGVLGAPLSAPPGRGVLGENSIRALGCAVGSCTL